MADLSWDQGGVCDVEDGGGCTRNSGKEAAQPVRVLLWALLPKEAQDGPALEVRPHLGSLNPDAPNPRLRHKQRQEEDWKFAWILSPKAAVL